MEQRAKKRQKTDQVRKRESRSHRPDLLDGAGRVVGLAVPHGAEALQHRHERPAGLLLLVVVPSVLVSLRRLPRLRQRHGFGPPLGALAGDWGLEIEDSPFPERSGVKRRTVEDLVNIPLFTTEGGQRAKGIAWRS